MHSLSSYCDLVIPLTCGSSFYANDLHHRFPRQFPHTNLKPIAYHTAAVLAAAIESITSVYRRYENPLSMSELADVVGISGRVVAEAHLALPFPLDATSGSLAATLLETGGIGADIPPWQSISAFVDSRANLNSGSGRGGGKRRAPADTRRRRRRNDVAAQYLNLNGVPADRVKSEPAPRRVASGGSSSSAASDSPLPRAISQCVTAEDVIRLYAAQTFPNCLTKINVMQNPMKTESPFPHIFDHFVSSAGLMLDGNEVRWARRTKNAEYWATRSSVRSHRSLVRLLRTTCLARALRCVRSLAHFAHSLAHENVNY